MRIGVVDITGTINGSGPFVGGIIPGVQLANGKTSGPSVTGDTIICPVGHPYDYNIHDCSGYFGSDVDIATMALQAAMDACTSGGNTWDQTVNQCVSPTQTIPGTLIPGVPDWAVYAVGGLLGFVALMSVMKGGR